MSALSIAGAVFVMFLWAICFPLIRVGLDSSPPMVFAALRALIAGSALLLIAQGLRRPPVAWRAVWTSVALVGFTATSLGFFGMFFGAGLISPGLATVIANMQPLIASVLAWAFLNEYLAGVQRLGLAIGFAGIVLIALPGFAGTGSHWQGLILILLGAVAIAISNVILKKLAGRVDIFRAMGWQLLIGAVPLGILAVTFEDLNAVVWSMQFVVNLTVLSLVGTSAAFVLWFLLLRRARLTELNVFSFLTPVFGLLMGSLFFAEQLQFLEGAGVLLSLVGIYAVSFRRKRTDSGVIS